MNMKIKYLSALPIIVVLILSGVSLAHAQVFTENLYYGLQNNSQVSQLQEFLTSQGLYSGPITGNYYFLTMSAVKAFQSQQGITPAAGYFGPLTLAAANKIADAEVGASNAQAITETGTSTPSAQTSSTAQLQLQALLQEVALLEQQLQTQQSSTQAVQNLQTQVQQQTQTLQQIASTTQPIATTAPQPSQAQAPTVSFTVNGTNSVTIPYDTAATISWSSTNTNSCNISPSGWSGTSGSQSTGNLTVSQTYSISCSGAGGSPWASVTVNVSAPVSQTSSASTSQNSGGNTTTTPASNTPTAVGSLEASGNNALGNYTDVFAGATNQEIGSYAFRASSVEAVKLNEIDIEATPDATVNYLQNLTLSANGSQFSQTFSAVSAGSVYKFVSNGAPITVPANETVDVNVYADVSSSTPPSTAFSPATVLTGCSAIGATSGGTIPCTFVNSGLVSGNSVNGQNFSIAAPEVIAVSTDPSQPLSYQLKMGQTGDTLAVFRFTESANVENVKITSLTITDTVSPTGAQPSFADLSLWNGSTLLATDANPPTPTANGYAYPFNFTFGNGIVVPQGNTALITLKGDVADSASAITDNSSHVFSIASANDMTTIGPSGGSVPTVNVTNASGNVMTFSE